MSRGPQPRQVAKAPAVVFVVDDDSMREALRSLFRSVKLRVETFGSTADFLRSQRPTAPAALCSTSDCPA